MLAQPATDCQSLSAYLLGTVAFEDALTFQRRLHYEIAGDRTRAALVLCEHFPLITVGRQGSRAHLRVDPAELQLRGWQMQWVQRGGGCVLHLPGQLAIYPIFPLDTLNLTVVRYLHLLAAVLRGVLADFSVSADVHLERGGLLVRDRLVASVGVAVRDTVSLFGAYLNVQPDLELFRTVHSGTVEPITSLARQRHGLVRPALVRERLVDRMREAFGFARVALFTEHSSLKSARLEAGDMTPLAR